MIRNSSVSNSAADQGFTETLLQKDVNGGGEEAIGAFKVAAGSYSLEHTMEISVLRPQAVETMFKKLKGFCLFCCFSVLLVSPIKCLTPP